MVKLVLDIFKIIRLLNRKLIGIHPFIHSLATNSRPIIWTRTSILFQAHFSFHHTNRHNISSTHTNLNTNWISSITVVILLVRYLLPFPISITLPRRQFHPVHLAFLFFIHFNNFLFSLCLVQRRLVSYHIFSSYILLFSRSIFQSFSGSLPPAIQLMVQVSDICSTMLQT